MGKAAVFTIVQDEPVFLSLWLRYYREHFDLRDIYILNHESRLGEETLSHAQLLGANVLPVYNPYTFDLDWLHSTVTKFHQYLLGSYDTVVFAEVDEIICTPDGQLGRYINDLRKPYAVCTGYEVVHKIEEEPALDFSAVPVLWQRNWWYWSKAYSKPLVTRQPIDWCKGFHYAPQTGGRNAVPEEDLYLIHLHKVDYEYKKSQILLRQERLFTQDPAHAAGIAQQRYVTDAELMRWWYRNIDGFPEFMREQHLEEMPSWARETV